MRRTQQRVDLQEQAKDAMNHISAYTMEADSAVWSDSAKLLTIVKKTVQNVGTAERKVSATDTYFTGKKMATFILHPSMIWPKRPDKKVMWNILSHPLPPIKSI